MKQDKDLSDLTISAIFDVAPACEKRAMDKAASLTTKFEEAIALHQSTSACKARSRMICFWEAEDMDTERRCNYRLFLQYIAKYLLGQVSSGLIYLYSTL